MKVYVFGNPDVPGDDIAFNITDALRGKIEGIEFISVKPNEDLPLNSEDKIIILDTIEGIDKVGLFNESDLDKLIIGKSVSVHDIDLGFQLKYLKKLGKLKNFVIIGLPKNKNVNYFRISSILRKLVEQEMQGS